MLNTSFTNENVHKCEKYITHQQNITRVIPTELTLIETIYLSFIIDTKNK